VSARHDAEIVAARMNAVGCLTKPVDLETFSTVVRAVMSIETGT
jgi:hypothetical protein